MHGGRSGLLRSPMPEETICLDVAAPAAASRAGHSAARICGRPPSPGWACWLYGGGAIAKVRAGRPDRGSRRVRPRLDSQTGRSSRLALTRLTRGGSSAAPAFAQASCFDRLLTVEQAAGGGQFGGDAWIKVGSVGSGRSTRKRTPRSPRGDGYRRTSPSPGGAPRAPGAESLATARERVEEKLRSEAGQLFPGESK